MRRGRGRSFGRAQVVGDGTLDPCKRRGEREVMGELGQDAARVAGVDALERFAESEVELDPAHARDSVVDGSPHKLVRER